MGQPLFVFLLLGAKFLFSISLLLFPTGTGCGVKNPDCPTLVAKQSKTTTGSVCGLGCQVFVGPVFGPQIGRWFSSDLAEFKFIFNSI